MGDIPPGSVVHAAFDYGARESVEELRAEVHRLELLVGELSGVLWGDSVLRDNGLRSKVAQLFEGLERINLAVGTCSRTEDECFGLQAMEEHLEEHAVSEQIEIKDLWLKYHELEGMARDISAMVKGVEGQGGMIRRLDGHDDKIRTLDERVEVLEEAPAKAAKGFTDDLRGKLLWGALAAAGLYAASRFGDVLVGLGRSVGGQ